MCKNKDRSLTEYTDISRQYNIHVTMEIMLGQDTDHLCYLLCEIQFSETSFFKHYSGECVWYESKVQNFQRLWI